MMLYEWTEGGGFIPGDDFGCVHHSNPVPHYHWIPIDAHTPQHCKLQLLGQGGVPIYGSYDGKDKFYTHWAPLPKLPEKEKQ